MAVQTRSTNAANLHIHYTKKLLSVFFPRLQLVKLGMKNNIPAGTGDTIKWLRYSKLASDTATLTEGTAPTEQGFTTANETAQVSQYGNFIKVSDMLEWTAIDSVQESLAELLGEQAAESLEDLCAAELDANLTVRRVSGETADNDITASHVLTMDELIKASIDLKDSYIPPHEMGAYMVVLSPANEYDIITETNHIGWYDARSFGARKPADIVKGEIGQLYGMRFLVSDKMDSTNNASSVPVKTNYVLGKEAFGCVDLAQKGVEMIRHKAGSGGVADPLNQYSTIGYKTQFVAHAFDSGARGRIVKAASAL